MAHVERKVMVSQEKIGNVVMWLVLALVALPALAQKPVVALTADDKSVSVNERLTFTVTFNIEGSAKIDFPTDFEVDMNVMHGMNQKMDPSGKLVTYYFVQQSGAFKKQGTYSFYAYVNYKGNKYKSNKLTVKVDEDAEDENNIVRSGDPVFGFIQASKATVYEGEPVLVKAKVFSKLPIVTLEGYAPFKTDKNAEEHVFPNQREYIEETRVNGKPALTFDYGKQLLIPVATGKCKILPFEMALRCQGNIFTRTVRFKSSGLSLFVKPLPGGAPKFFIGGVGVYQLTEKLSGTSVKQGDVLSLELTVTGTGNLHNINTPVLDLPDGCSVYGDPERIEDFQFTEDGVTGSIVFTYHIQFTGKGELTIPAQSIAYFDPRKEKYVVVRGESFIVSVREDKNFKPLTTKLSPTDNGSSKKIVESASKKREQESPNNWILTLFIGAPVGLLSIFLLLLFKRKKKPSFSANEQPAAPPADSFQFESISEVNYLKKAAELIDDPSQFAVILPKAIVQEIGFIQKSPCLSREEALVLINSQFPEVALQLRILIETCDYYRYGFGGEVIDTAQLLSDTKTLLSRIN